MKTVAFQCHLSSFSQFLHVQFFSFTSIFLPFIHILYAQLFFFTFNFVVFWVFSRAKNRFHRRSSDFFTGHGHFVVPRELFQLKIKSLATLYVHGQFFQVFSRELFSFTVNIFILFTGKVLVFKGNNKPYNNL